MVPDKMILAWLHLVIGLIHGSQGDLSWEEYLSVADGLVRKGMNETMLDLEAPELLSSTVVQPLDLVSLLTFQLLKDSTEGEVNLSDTYQNHLMGLVSSMKWHEKLWTDSYESRKRTLTRGQIAHISLA